MPQPLVSILINNYNYAEFLGEAIDSALAQTYPSVQVVVVDDGSTDRSRLVIERYQGRIVPVIKQNGGQASAFNAGFLASTGDIVCFLDSDDLFLPGKVARVVEILEADSEIGWCFDRLRLFKGSADQARLAAPSPVPTQFKFGRWDERATAQRKGIIPYIPAATSAISFRRSTLARILPMPVAKNVMLHDNYIKIYAAGISAGVMSSEELSLQRIHQNNAYTGMRAGKRQFAARVALLTGFHLFEQAPLLRRLALRVFSAGLGRCWITGAYDSGARILASSLARKLTAIDKMKLYLMAVKAGLRCLLESLPARP
jgi:glycosyltransferase involved in cell wall biosynthesis